MGDDRLEASLSGMYHALRATRRRRVVRNLSEEDENSISVRLLAKEIAAQEHSIPQQRATGEPYRNVYNALSQTHLPALSKAGIIIYDPDRQNVLPGPNLELAALLVDITRPTITLLYEDPDDDLLWSE